MLPRLELVVLRVLGSVCFVLRHILFDIDVLLPPLSSDMGVLAGFSSELILALSLCVEVVRISGLLRWSPVLLCTRSIWDCVIGLE